jgi:signal peptidase II
MFQQKSDKKKKNLFLNNEYKISLIIFLSIFILDFFTKLLIKLNTIRTTNHFLDIYYTTNTGSLFSLFANFKYINLIFIILSFIALFLMIYFLKENIQLKNNYYIPLSIIIAGIFSNLIDRIIYGSVVDWINFHFYPVFNIADSAIVIGVVYLFILLIKEK